MEVKPTVALGLKKMPKRLFILFLHKIIPDSIIYTKITTGKFLKKLYTEAYTVDCRYYNETSERSPSWNIEGAYYEIIIRIGNYKSYYSMTIIIPTNIMDKTLAQLQTVVESS